MRSNSYPETASERNRWILERRGPKRDLDPLRPYAFFCEDEIGANGKQLSTATLFLTNRECPYRCLMCDLWQDTLDTDTQPGAIATQIETALEALPPASQIKLYNAGSFFDPKAIPPSEYPEIARLTSCFDRIIVECHPGFLGNRVLEFKQQISCKLEVAIGLETVHPVALDRLNKRFTVDDFRRSAEFLSSHGVDLRVFLLVKPPFLSEMEGIEWAQRSLDVSFECGATACTVIPVRVGNGAMEAIAAETGWTPPSIASVERVQEYGIGLGEGRVFADLWDVPRYTGCACNEDRISRMAYMNKTQSIPPAVICSLCERDNLRSN